MKKDKFQGHSVKRPYSNVMNKKYRKMGNRAFRRLAVENDEMSILDGWWRKVNHRTNSHKLYGYDIKTRFHGHYYESRKGNHGKRTWDFNNSEKYKALDGNRFIKVAGKKHYLTK